MGRKIAIIAFNLGGPDSLDTVEPFLFNLFSDPAIIRLPNPFRFILARLISKRRAPEAKHIYSQIGNRSPIVPLSQAQMAALETKLNTKSNDQFRTFIVMRYWHPMADEVAREVKEFGPDEVVLLPLYPQFSTTTTASSFKDWERAAHKAGLTMPHHRICCYPDNADFVEAYVQLALPIMQRALAENPNTSLFLSAHGLPEKVVKAGDPYPLQVEAGAQAIIKGLEEKLGQSIIAKVTYQSRVGPLKWIGPATDDMIIEAGREGRSVVILPIAFVSEHSETLVELDLEYAALAKESGVPYYHRVPTVDCHQSFIKALSDLVGKARAGTCTRFCGNGVTCLFNPSH